MVLKNEHKDIYDQVVNEATKNERERIKAIEDLAIPGNEDIINKAIGMIENCDLLIFR